MIRNLCALLLVGLSLSASPLFAQDEAEIDAFFEFVEQGRGLPSLRPALGLRNDAQAMAFNPAELGFLENAGGAYLYSASDAFNSGHGLYAASPVFAGLALGASAEFLGPGQDIFARRYQLAAAYAYADTISVGLRYRFFGSETLRDIDTFSTLDLGFSVRWLPYLAASLVIEHADTPRLEGRWLQPIVRAGLGLVFLEGRLDLDAFYTVPQSEDGIGDFSMTLRGEPLDGLHLFASGEGGDAPIRFGGGLSLVQGYFSLGLGVYANADIDTGDVAFDGFAASFSAFAAPRRSLYRASERWIRIDMPADLAERAPRSPFGIAGQSFAELLLTLQQIGKDNSVDGLLLDIDGLAFGYSQLYELRTELVRLRRSGHRIVAHMRDTSTRSLYLASAADRIYITGAQTFDAYGLSTTLSYYRNGLRFLGVEPEFVKIDRYKTAPEAFLRDGPSEFSVEQMDLYLDAIYNQLVADIAQGRNLSDGDVRALFDASPITPEEAQALGFIDGIAYRDEMGERIRTDFNLSAEPRLEQGYTAPSWDETDWHDPQQIAVIHVDGAIARGKSVEVPILGSMTTGAETISDMLEAAVASPRIRAIILRVDSPGGSAFASEVMHRAIVKARKSKPLIISMSNIAASGGYYVAAPGQRILATPMTLTGSIGIYAGKFDITGLLNMLGVTRVLMKRGAFADLYSPNTGWTDAHRERAMASITYLYDVFITRVAEGRDMPEDEVRKIAEGHIWPGRVAQQIGLVDELGGLLDAIDLAKELGGLEADDRVRIVQLPPRGPLSAYEIGIPNLISTSLGAFMPTPLVFDLGEPLMLLPFDWMLR